MLYYNAQIHSIVITDDERLYLQNISDLAEIFRIFAHFVRVSINNLVMLDKYKVEDTQFLYSW